MVELVQLMIHTLTFPLGARDTRTSLQHMDHAGTWAQESSIHCLKGTLFFMEKFSIRGFFRKVSSHFEYLENRSRGFVVTWQPVRGDLTVHL